MPELGQRAREGLRQVAGFFTPDVAKALRRLAVERDTTLQGLLAEAINDLLVKYGGSRIADESPRPRGGAAVKARQATAP